jgi:hypothetical protein
MQINWVEKKILAIENWLRLNEGQMFFPTMDEDNLLHKKDIKHKKEMLGILVKIRNH